jgi:A/G-specific adenine glycosylase
MRRALLQWFAVRGRALPWRTAAARADPYRVFVAEVMLQQTQVATAVPYYRRWLKRFPDLEVLAAASDDEVLLLWQGLGYYRRALNLKRAAAVVLERHGGALPSERSALEALPGVGRYTAAAIAALAFGEPAIAVDGNVRRLAARLHAWPALPRDGEVEAALRTLLGPPAQGEPAPLAEALIELGALLCTPRAPACDRCPLLGGCAAAARGAPERYPKPRPRRPPPQRRRFALVALADEQVWLMRRPPDALLGGLWGFPQLAAAPVPGQCLQAVRHAYSHFRLELVPVVIACDHPALDAAGAQARPLASLPQLALSAVDRRVLEVLHQQGLVPETALS